MKKDRKKIKIRLRSASSFKRHFIFTIVFSVILIGLLFVTIFTPAFYGALLWVPITVIGFSVLGILFFTRLAIGCRIDINFGLRLFVVKERPRILKKTCIEFSNINEIKYKLYPSEESVGGFGGPGPFFQKHCPKTGERVYDGHGIVFTLKTGEIVESNGVDYSKGRDPNGQLIDVTEQKTREVVDKLNDILNGWREKNEIQSLQEGNLSDNIEAVQNREYEDTEQLTE